MKNTRTALIVGASRGLGLALAKEFLARGWSVIGTVRKGRRTGLHDLAEQSGGRLEIAYADMTDPSDIEELKAHVSERPIDLLFVNAGIGTSREATVAGISTEDFERIMVTNALSPMRIVEQLGGMVVAHGTIGIMSSGQGSIADNERGGAEVYRASKAALNMLMRSFSTRHPERSLLLMAPGWVKTDLGGPEAKFYIEEVIPALADTILAQLGKKGLQFLDRFGKPVRW